MTGNWTALDMQTALMAELAELFKNQTFSGPTGRRTMRIYEQDMPPADRYADDADAEPSPYCIVRLEDGELPTIGPQTVGVTLTFSLYADDEKTGHREVMHIIQLVAGHFTEQPVFGGRFEAIPPFYWGRADQDKSPYYYGSMTFLVTAPKPNRRSKFA